MKPRRDWPRERARAEFWLRQLRWILAQPKAPRYRQMELRLKGRGG